MQELEHQTVAPQVARGEPERFGEAEQLRRGVVGRADLTPELEAEELHVKAAGARQVAHALADMVEHDTAGHDRVWHGEHPRATVRWPRVQTRVVLGGMRRQCGRPGCSSVATVTFSFDATNCVVWLDPIADGTPRAGDLCTRHADLMSPPRDWDRIDRRPPRPEPASVAVGAAAVPMTTPAPATTPVTTRAKTAPKRSAARRRSRVEQPAMEPLEAAQPAPPIHPAQPAWLPRNASEEDLDGVLDVSTPLLSRAFDQARPSETTPADE